MPDDEYDQLMQEDKAARERQAVAIAITINSVGTNAAEAWEYLPIDNITVEQVLAVLEVAHGMGIVEWESWHEGS